MPIVSAHFRSLYSSQISQRKRSSVGPKRQAKDSAFLRICQLKNSEHRSTTFTSVMTKNRSNRFHWNTVYAGHIHIHIRLITAVKPQV